MALRAVSDGAAVVVCNTCRHAPGRRIDEAGVAGGARLASKLRDVKASSPRYAGVAVQDMPCLFACADFCTVYLRAPGKISYLLGRFEATAEDARAILDYAALYAESEIGEVPYRAWPEGVKGHFITRTPPAGFVIE